MKLITLSIPCGDVLLSGLHYVPDVIKSPVIAILAHGFTSGKYSMDSLASYLAGKGYSAVTFDAVGHKLGGSGGSMERIGEAADNLQAVVDWCRQNIPSSTIALVGHSMGAAAAIQVAAWECARAPDRIPLIGIACLCMGVRPTDGFRGVLGSAMLKQRSDYVSGAPAAELLGGIDLLLASAPSISAAMPVLLIAAKNDVLLPVENVQLLAQQIGEHAAVKVVDAMHIDAPDKARGVVTNWMEELAVVAATPT